MIGEFEIDIFAQGALEAPMYDDHDREAGRRVVSWHDRNMRP